MRMKNKNEGVIKIRIQRVVVIISLVLMAGKFSAYFLTNSVGILTDAMESIVNVAAGFVSLYCLWLASKPIDRHHPFGQGKAELISASLEGLMILVAGGVIVLEGVGRLFNPVPVGRLDIGIVIIAASGVVNYIAGWWSIRVGRRYQSEALIASGKHLQSDTYSTIGLVVGLLLMLATGLRWIDSALAIIFGAIIMVTGVSILRKTISNLMDKSDPELLREIAVAINENRKNDWIDIHNLKALKYGNLLYIDCDLTVPWYYSIVQGHECDTTLSATICDAMEYDVVVSVHTDPCKAVDCPRCLLFNCPHRLSVFEYARELTLTYMTGNDESVGEGPNVLSKHGGRRCDDR